MSASRDRCCVWFDEQALSWTLTKNFGSLCYSSFIVTVVKIITYVRRAAGCRGLRVLCLGGGASRVEPVFC